MMFKKISRNFAGDFVLRLSGPIFWVKLNLQIYKTVRDFKTSSLYDIAAANVCTMKKTGGLYHVSERRYFNSSPGRFSEIAAILPRRLYTHRSKSFRSTVYLTAKAVAELSLLPTRPPSLTFLEIPNFLGYARPP
jgi:hypothetical protein